MKFCQMHRKKQLMINMDMRHLKMVLVEPELVVLVALADLEMVKDLILKIWEIFLEVSLVAVEEAEVKVQKLIKEKIYDIILL